MSSFAESSNSPGRLSNTFPTPQTIPAVAQGFIRDNLYTDDSDDPSFNAEFSDDESEEQSLTDESSISGDENIADNDGSNGRDIEKSENGEARLGNVENYNTNKINEKRDTDVPKSSEHHGAHDTNIPRETVVTDDDVFRKAGGGILCHRIPEGTPFNARPGDNVEKDAQDIVKDLVRLKGSQPLCNVITPKVISTHASIAANLTTDVSPSSSCHQARTQECSNRSNQLPCDIQHVSQNNLSHFAFHTASQSSLLNPDLPISSQRASFENQNSKIWKPSSNAVGPLGDLESSQLKELPTKQKIGDENFGSSFSEQEKGPSLEEPVQSVLFLPASSENDVHATNINAALDDDDDPNDPDFQMPVPEVDLEEEDLDQTEACNADYVEFLTNFFIESQTANKTRSEQREAFVNSSEHIGEGPSTTDLNIQDEDDDFDYLRESALVRDDPLEYRDDMTVPIKEVIQLLGETDNTPSLRPQTRASKPKATKAKRTNASAQAKSRMSAVNVMPALEPQSGFPDRNSASLSRKVFECTGDAPKLSGSSPVPMGYTVGTAAQIASNMTYMSLPTNKIMEFKHQLAAFVQITTQIHWEMARELRRFEPHPQSNNTITERDQDMTAVALVCRRSNAILSRLVSYGTLSNKYHTLLSDNLKKTPLRYGQIPESIAMGRPVADGLRVSVIDNGLVTAVESFMQEVSGQRWNGNDGALKSLEIYKRSDISAALRRRVSHPQSSNGLDRPPIWSSEDDFLLAMTIAKHGREFGENCRDLLPHRDVDDCQLRVRFLSSRRCPDNSVKRQMLILNTPLTPEEIQKVRYGLQQYGSESDCETWKRIQRELLPGRDWSYLQKLWNWREKRRKYKAKYRAKVNAKRRRTNHLETNHGEEM